MDAGRWEAVRPSEKDPEVEEALSESVNREEEPTVVAKPRGEENNSATREGKGDGEDAGPKTREADSTSKDDTDTGRQEAARPSVKDPEAGETLSEREDGEEEPTAVATPRGGETVPRPSHAPRATQGTVILQEGHRIRKNKREGHECRRENGGGRLMAL
ncbi:hypothetical protein NDU88_003914 [Pleurodeles waltl]|uniref:Uncharacterized protein n=1 Tax=Pleurodeles waltl TaxID=8319 RepID=A0AAV7VH95_PLEWA|nr:hypothetical protein NDU88_003914 [Pleurodeles waltl]